MNSTATRRLSRLDDNPEIIDAVPAGAAETLAIQDGDAEPKTIADEEIATKAYYCWQRRGCPEGSPEVDWQEAQDELNKSSPR